MQEFFTIAREASSPKTWSRGVELARGGAVVLASSKDREWVVRVAVAGQAVSPTVTLWPDDEEWHCDCADRSDPCAHVVAAIIALKRGIKGGSESQQAPPDLTAKVEYQLERGAKGLELHRKLVQRSSHKALQCSLATLSRGGRGTGVSVAASKQDIAVELAMGQRVQGGWLPEPALKRVLEALRELPGVTLDGEDVTIAAPRAAVEAVVEDAGHGFKVTLVAPSGAELFRNGAILADGRLAPTLDPPLTARERAALEAGQVFAAGDAARLVGELLPRLQGQLPVSIRTQRLPQTRTEPPRLALDVSRDGDQLALLATLVYGKPPVARVSAGLQLSVLRQDGVVPLRDADEEQRLVRRLHKSLGLRLGHPQRYSGEEALQVAARLRALSDADVAGKAHHDFYLAAPMQAKLSATDTTFALRFETQSDVQQDAPGSATVDATRVLAAWQAGQSLVALDGGGFAPLPVDWLQRFGPRVAALLDMQDQDGTVKPVGKIELARLCEDLQHPPPPNLAQLRRMLEGFSGIPAAALPNDLAAELRDYQRRGVDWLCTMRQAGMGALLADDMGLGKTLQAMCALTGRALVVTPASVLRNWEAELKRFRPGLRCSVYHGPDRTLDAETDVTLTTYAILRLDVDRLQTVPWATVILDESQTIRNPTSQVAQAAYGLRAKWRLALSGTPVENRLDDLWSHFHFLNRGLLGGQTDFGDRFAQPIANGDRGTAQLLRQRVRPFILRRLKQDVAEELPPRTELVLRCQLSPSEREVYQAIRAATRQQVVDQLREGAGVLEALAALLRLRQAACHAALVPGQQADSSAKVELLLETLQQVVAESHKALVFSQWTSLLDLLEPQLQQADLAYLRLDGTTRDRQSVVNRFQQADGPPVLLISLKAGGVGLTLTAADHVFLMDPWWNPAAEAQAADRAHRIGQTRPVFIHRLIADDTVEDGILALQQQKRTLATAALQGADQASKLSREDLLALLA